VSYLSGAQHFWFLQLALISFKDGQVMTPLWFWADEYCEAVARSYVRICNAGGSCGNGIEWSVPKKWMRPFEKDEWLWQWL
jgi:hypothetical protein